MLASGLPNGAISAAFRVAFNDLLEDVWKDVKHVGGFLVSKDLGKAVLRTAQTVGGGAEAAAGAIACGATVGLGCGLGIAMMADGASNIHGAVINDAGFMQQGVRNIVTEVGGSETTADSLYTAGTFFLSYKAFTAPVKANTATHNPQTIIPGNPGRLNFLKPEVRTVQAFTQANAFGLGRDAVITGSGVVSYLNSLYSGE